MRRLTNTWANNEKEYISAGDEELQDECKAYPQSHQGEEKAKEEAEFREKHHTDMEEEQENLSSPLQNDLVQGNSKKNILGIEEEEESFLKKTKKCEHSTSPNAFLYGDVSMCALKGDLEENPQPDTPCEGATRTMKDAMTTLMEHSSVPFGSSSAAPTTVPPNTLELQQSVEAAMKKQEAFNHVFMQRLGNIDVMLELIESWIITYRENHSIV